MKTRREPEGDAAAYARSIGRPMTAEQIAQAYWRERKLERNIARFREWAQEGKQDGR